MNKTISVNIGGRVFNIEELAYDKLNRYLNTIRGYFENHESTDEIISDIELRIAELFMERISNQKQVITLADVDEIITIMGKPEDYVDAEEDEDDPEFASAKSARAKRRVFRDPDNKVVAGVCSGISAYFGIDPIILRAIFAISFVFYGSGLLVYIVLAIIIPKAKTTAEKLQMHGEAVTVDNISRKVNESFQDMKDDIKDFGKKNNINEEKIRDTGRQAGNFISDLFSGLGNVLRVVLVILAKVIGVCLIIAGISGIFFSLALFFGWENIIMLANTGMVNEELLPSILNKTFTSDWGRNMFAIGALITLIVPAILFFLLGIRLLFEFRRTPVWIGIVLIILWFGGLSMLAAGGTDLYSQFKIETEYTEDVPLEFSESDTLYLDIVRDGASQYSFTHGFDDGEFYFDSDVTFPGVNSTDILYMQENEFTVEINRSDSLFRLRFEREARGASQADAVSNAKSIVSFEKVSGDSLLINPYFAVLKEGNFRGQECKYILSIPVGKSIHFTKGSRRIIDDIPNTTDTYDGKMIGHTWRMTPEGLSNDYFIAKQKQDKDDDDDD